EVLPINAHNPIHLGFTSNRLEMYCRRSFAGNTGRTARPMLPSRLLFALGALGTHSSTAHPPASSRAVSSVVPLAVPPSRSPLVGLACVHRRTGPWHEPRPRQTARFEVAGL